MKIIRLPLDFPLGEVSSLLDITPRKRKIIENILLVELSEFDYEVLVEFLDRQEAAND
jgi:hypothetical protein